MWTRVLSLAAMAAPAWADPPLSAVDWLTSPEARAPAVRAGRGAARPEIPMGGVASAIPTNPIVVTPLGPPDPGAAGVLPASVTGLPRTLWAGSDPERLVRLVSALPRSSVPAIDALAQTLMLAEADPPRAAGPDDAEALLLARVDQLVDRGALDAARALLDRAGPRTPERRRRAFDAALLLGDETAACRTVAAEARADEDYARRVFCLLRNGDWAAGALTFDGARALGALDPVEEELLATFIDDEAAPEPPPPAAGTPSPLAFRLHDALGQAMPTGDLPVAYARSDLRAVTGWKAQLEAAERLARAGVVGGNALMALLTEREPSASGGIWDRVAAIQALDAALARGDPGGVAAALPAAWEAMTDAGTAIPLASVLAPRLEEVALEGRAADLALRLALLSPDYEAAAAGAGGDAPALAVARGEAPARPGDEPLPRAVAEGFDGGPAPRAARPARAGRRPGRGAPAGRRGRRAGRRGRPRSPSRRPALPAPRRARGRRAPRRPAAPHLGKLTPWTSNRAGSRPFSRLRRPSSTPRATRSSPTAAT